MAVTFPTQTVQTREDVVNPTISFTVPTGVTDGCVIVCMSDDAQANPTGITYKGSAMTRFNGADSADGVRVQMWEIATGAVVGAGDIIVSGHGNDANYAVFCLAGVDQTTSVENWNSATGESDTPSVVITSATDDMVIDVVAMTEEGTSLTPGAGQTEIADVSVEERMGVSREAGGASITMSWTAPDATVWIIGGASFKAAAAGTLFFQNVEGVLSFAGAQVKETDKLVAGSLSFAGAVGKLVSISPAGALSFVGVLNKETQEVADGTLSFGGDLGTLLIPFAAPFPYHILEKRRRELSGLLTL